MLVRDVRPCVIVVRHSVIGHVPPCTQNFGRRHSLRVEQVLCVFCIWEVMCGGQSEAVQGVHGLRVTGVVPVLGICGVAGSKAACRVWTYRVFSGCMLCVCECGGMNCRGVVEGSPALFVRAEVVYGQ